MIVYTGGTFDILHAGHVNFFLRIKKLFPESTLVVSLNTDEFVERYKSAKPVFSLTERIEHVLMTGYVDEIIVNEGNEDSTIAINKVMPSIIAVGSDWVDKDYCKQMNFNGKWLADKNINLIYIPNKNIISSSIIKSQFN